MIIKRMVVGPLMANCYLLADGNSGEAAIIDPGGEGERIEEEIERNGWRPVVLINTHGHIDHIQANAFLKKRYNLPLLIHAEDSSLLSQPTPDFDFLLRDDLEIVSPDRYLSEGDKITFGSQQLEVIHTPGHSRGSICLRLKRPRGGEVIFTGDTLFAAGIGRTDFSGGSLPQLLNSIKTKLLAFPDDTVIYPGHGSESTIGRERKTNPFLL